MATARELGPILCIRAFLHAEFALIFFFSGFPLYYADDLMKDMGVDESAKPEYERSIVESCVVGDGV